MRKSIILTASSIIILAGYIIVVLYRFIPRWVVIMLAPIALISAVFALAMLAGYVILLVEAVSVSLAGMKEKFLLKYGVETQAFLSSTEMYHGPGLHKADPCYRGIYRFTDLQGHVHSYRFSSECYDPYDLSSLDSPIDDCYKEGVTRRLLYWKWLPFIHHLYGPEVNAPRLHGRFGLYRLK